MFVHGVSNLVLATLFGICSLTVTQAQPTGEYATDEFAGGLWHMNETSGSNVSNSSGNGKHDFSSTGGSISGMKFNDVNGNSVKDANEPGLPNWFIDLEGDSSRFAVQLDGSDDYVDLGDSIILPGGAFSISCWVRPASDSFGVANYWFLYRFKSTTEFFAGQNPNTGFGFSFRLFPQYYAQAPFSPGHWHHYVVTYNGGDKSLQGSYAAYGDGVPLMLTQGPVAGPAGGSNQNILGQDNNHTPGTFYDGALDELSIWNGVLTQEQICELMHHRLTGTETALLGYWPFDEGTGITTNDSSSYGNVGNLINGAGWMTSAAPAVGSTTTDTSGTYMFSCLPQDTYSVTEELMPNWVQTFPPLGSYSFSLVEGQDTSGIDFGNAQQQLITVSIADGWNMISNPAIAMDDTVRHLYPTSTFEHAFSFTPSGYTKDTTMENGIGYWEKFPAAVSQPVTGLQHTVDSISVLAGWNMVGTISNPVDTSAIVSIPPGLRGSPWYGYSGSYFVATQLIPGQAYWVKANSAGRFVLANPLRDRP